MPSWESVKLVKQKFTKDLKEKYELCLPHQYIFNHVFEKCSSYYDKYKVVGTIFWCCRLERVTSAIGITWSTIVRCLPNSALPPPGSLTDLVGCCFILAHGERLLGSQTISAYIWSWFTRVGLRAPQPYRTLWWGPTQVALPYHYESNGVETWRKFALFIFST